MSFDALNTKTAFPFVTPMHVHCYQSITCPVKESVAQDSLDISAADGSESQRWENSLAVPSRHPILKAWRRILADGGAAWDASVSVLRVMDRKSQTRSMPCHGGNEQRQHGRRLVSATQPARLRLCVPRAPRPPRRGQLKRTSETLPPAVDRRGPPAEQPAELFPRRSA